MSAIPILLLADEQTDAVLRSWRFMDSYSRWSLVLFGAIGLVILLVLFWSLFFWKRRRRRSRRHGHHNPLSIPLSEVPWLRPRRSHHRRHHSHSQPTEAAAATSGDGAPATSERRHHLRRPHRPRNPTLAETGGLPSIRAEDPSEHLGGRP